MASVQSYVEPKVVPTLDQVVRRIHEISTLPHIALRVMEVANNPNAGARELKEVMEGDAALSTRVLRCVNSSAYAVRTKITNLQQAIAYLGIKQIRNLAMTASVSRLFEKSDKVGAYCREGLWRHLVAVGVCARLAAMRLRVREFEDVFLAGLLHDIGLILEDQHLHKPFVEVLKSLRKEVSLQEVETQQLGFDHTRLGEAIAQTWRFPEGAIDAIRHHHDSSSYGGSLAQTVQCVELANFLCSAKGISSVGMHLVAFPRHAITALNLSKEDILVLAEDLDREIQSNQTLFQV